MILYNQSDEPLEQMATLFFREIIDLLYVRPNGKNTLPPGDRVGANDRVFGAQIFADIFRRTAWTRVDFEIVVLGNLVESGLSICCC